MAFGVTTYGSGAVGILSANIVSLQQSLGGQSAYTTLGINTYRYDLFQGSCVTIDNSTITQYIDPIASKKGEINAFGTTDQFLLYPKYYSTEVAAESAAASIYGTAGESSTDGVLSETTTYISLDITYETPATFTAGDVVTEASGSTYGTVAFTTSLVLSGSDYVGKYAVKTWNKNAGVGIGSTMTASGITTTTTGIQYIGVGSVFKDIIAVTIYPNLEPANPNADNPFAGRRTEVSSTSNAGLGVGNSFYANAIANDTFEDYIDVSGTLPYLQDDLAFDTALNPTGLTTISSLRTEVQTLRTGITSYVGAGATVKDLKKGYAVNIWSLSNNAVVAQQQINDLNNAISILQDPTFQ